MAVKVTATQQVIREIKDVEYVPKRKDSLFKYLERMKKRGLTLSKIPSVRMEDL